MAPKAEIVVDQDQEKGKEILKDGRNVEEKDLEVVSENTEKEVVKEKENLEEQSVNLLLEQKGITQTHQLNVIEKEKEKEQTENVWKEEKENTQVVVVLGIRFF